MGTFISSSVKILFPNHTHIKYIKISNEVYCEGDTGLLNMMDDGLLDVFDGKVYYVFFYFWFFGLGGGRQEFLFLGNTF